MFFCCFNQNKNNLSGTPCENILQYARDIIVALPFFDQTTETSRYFFQINTLARDSRYEISIYFLPERSSYIKIITDLSLNRDDFALMNRGQMQNFMLPSHNIEIIETNMTKEQIDEFNDYIIREYCPTSIKGSEPTETDKKKSWWCSCV